MRYCCMFCQKAVSSELPEDALVRASLICPECLELADRKALEKTLQSIKDRLARETE